jgi:hypothetical protein
VTDDSLTEKHPYASNGVSYRRALGPEIFSTSWNYVDHMIIPAGKAIGAREMPGVEEVYYVIKDQKLYGGSTRGCNEIPFSVFWERQWS